MGDVPEPGSVGLLNNVFVAVFPDASTSSKSQALVLGRFLSIPGPFSVPALSCTVSGSQEACIPHGFQS